MFQLNFIGILLMLIGASILILIPSFIIQSFWNGFYASSIERDLSIEWWQASLLWGALLTLLYTTGIFKIKLDIKELDSIDLEQISDPELRADLEEALQKQNLKEQKVQETKAAIQKEQDQDTAE